MVKNTLFALVSAVSISVVAQAAQEGDVVAPATPHQEQTVEGMEALEGNAPQQEPKSLEEAAGNPAVPSPHQAEVLEDGNQAQKAVQSTETRQPTATGQGIEQSTQGGEAYSPARESLSATGADAAGADALNQLLENELSSVQSYERALEKFRPEGDRETIDIYQQLKTIHQHHQDAALKLKTQVQQAGGTPIEDSGAKGIWAEIITGGAALLGNKTALEALKQGEESSVEEYQQILQSENIPSQASSLIQTALLPRQQTHVAELDGLIQDVEKLEATAEKAQEKAEQAEEEADKAAR